MLQYSKWQLTDFVFHRATVKYQLPNCTKQQQKLTINDPQE
jgi:hypothetical protein